MAATSWAPDSPSVAIAFLAVAAAPPGRRVGFADGHCRADPRQDRAAPGRDRLVEYRDEAPQQHRLVVQLLRLPAYPTSSAARADRPARRNRRRWDGRRLVGHDLVRYAACLYRPADSGTGGPLSAGFQYTQCCRASSRSIGRSRGCSRPPSVTTMVCTPQRGPFSARLEQLLRGLFAEARRVVEDDEHPVRLGQLARRRVVLVNGRELARAGTRRSPSRCARTARPAGPRSRPRLSPAGCRRAACRSRRDAGSRRPTGLAPPGQ